MKKNNVSSHLHDTFMRFYDHVQAHVGGVYQFSVSIRMAGFNGGLCSTQLFQVVLVFNAVFCLMVCKKIQRIG